MVVYYDGTCNLCNAAISWIRKSPRSKTIQCEALSEKEFIQLFSEFRADQPMADSVVVKSNGIYYIESDAILLIAKRLGGLYRLFSVAKILPKESRDKLYRYIARNRYRWFGRTPAC
jgi:predicted DCC family thiol-disulfide oxidoreductase YuxK